MNRTRAIPFSTFGLVLLSASGCKPPPPAPEKLEELADYIFAHADDEDQIELSNGLDNLDVWLSKGGNLESTTEGYTVSQLQKSSVSDLGHKNTDVSKLIGAAVAIRHTASMKQIAKTTVVEDWSEVAKGTYAEYTRSYNNGPNCFPDKSCEEVTASAYSRSSWAGLIDVESRNKIDWRWVFSEESETWYLVHRSWLKEPATVTPDNLGIEVYAQYFLGVAIPGKNETVRLMVTWIDSEYGAIPMSDDTIKSNIVSSLQDQGEAIEKWNE